MVYHRVYHTIPYAVFLDPLEPIPDDPCQPLKSMKYYIEMLMLMNRLFTNLCSSSVHIYIQTAISSD